MNEAKTSTRNEGKCLEDLSVVGIVRTILGDLAKSVRNKEGEIMVKKNGICVCFFGLN